MPSHDINAFMVSPIPIEAALRELFDDHLATVELPPHAVVTSQHRALLERVGLPLTGPSQPTRGHINTWFPPGTGWPEVDFPEDEIALRELDGGLVMAIELRTGAVIGRRHSERSLVSSSIGTLLATVVLVESVWQDVGWSVLLGEDAIPDVVRQICAVIDPPAHSDRGQHWPGMLEVLIAEMSM